MTLNAVDVISKIETVDVLRALEDIAAFEIPTRRASRKFCLEHGTQHYPPKYVISVASAFTFSDTDELERQLDPGEFAGGEQSNSRLRELGFNVISCTCGGQSQTIGTSPKKTETNTLSVTRLIVDGEAALTPKKAAAALKAVLRAMARDGEHSDVLITPGGFVSLDMKRADYAVGWDTPKDELQKLVKNVRPLLEPLLSQIVSDTNRAAADFLTLGVDVSFRSDHHAELVATIEIKSGKVSAWTGKSHPTQHQEQSLMHVTDLGSHLQDINGHSVLVLGCHDLNMFSARSMATRDPGGTRGKRADRLIRDAQRSKVVAVLQHPHSTDTPAIWAGGWSGVRLKLRPDTYASGIAYNNRGSSVRAPLNEVLMRTSTGNVIDYVWTAGGTVRRMNPE